MGRNNLRSKTLLLTQKCVFEFLLLALYDKIEKPVNDNIRPNDPIPI